MSDDQVKYISAAVCSLALAYFVTHLHSAGSVPSGGQGIWGGMYIVNNITGTGVMCYEANCMPIGNAK